MWMFDHYTLISNDKTASVIWKNSRRLVAKRLLSQLRPCLAIWDGNEEDLFLLEEWDRIQAARFVIFNHAPSNTPESENTSQSPAVSTLASELAPTPIELGNFGSDSEDMPLAQFPTL